VGQSTEPSSTASGSSPTTKVLTIVEENHSLDQMRAEMPYLHGLAERFGYSNTYTAVAHPSLPNYLAIAGGDTFGVTDDHDPAQHPVGGASVFGQAVAAGRSAGVYAESMPGHCVRTGSAHKGYAVRHNPWAYFVDERAICDASDRSADTFAADATASRLPEVAMLIPNTCNDAHDTVLGCDLGTADRWLRRQLPAVLDSEDFRAGRLVVVVTADEDDRKSGNRILTVVLAHQLDGAHRVSGTALTHYSLSRLYSEVVGAPPLRKAAKAADLAAAFGLSVR
jgi:acid phosphatase